MVRILLLSLPLAVLVGCAPAFDAFGARAGDDPGTVSPPTASVEVVDLGHVFDGLTGSFVLLDGRTGHHRVFNPEDAATRFLPASTFKIASSLIALETGVVSGIDEVRERDRAVAPEQAWWPSAWLEPHSIRSGFQASTVWLYQALAREIGDLRMLDWLHRLDYGNASIDGGIDRFWLSGGLRISAFEQVDFLRRLHEGALPVEAASRSAVSELLVLERGEDWLLGGKTGWTGLGTSGRGVGWLVGHVQQPGAVHYFATRIDVVEGTEPGERMRITRAALSELLDIDVATVD